MIIESFQTTKIPFLTLSSVARREVFYLPAYNGVSTPNHIGLRFKSILGFHIGNWQQ